MQTLKCRCIPAFTKREHCKKFDGPIIKYFIKGVYGFAKNMHIVKSVQFSNQRQRKKKEMLLLFIIKYEFNFSDIIISVEREINMFCEMVGNTWCYAR